MPDKFILPNLLRPSYFDRAVLRLAKHIRQRGSDIIRDDGA